MKKSILIAGSVTAAAGTATAIAVPIALTSGNVEQTSIEFNITNTEDAGMADNHQEDDTTTTVIDEAKDATHEVYGQIIEFEVTSCGNSGDDIVITSDRFESLNSDISAEDMVLVIPCSVSSYFLYSEVEAYEFPGSDVKYFLFNLYWGEGDYSPSADMTKHIDGIDATDISYMGDYYDEDSGNIEQYKLSINGSEEVDFLKVSSVTTK